MLSVHLRYTRLTSCCCVVVSLGHSDEPGDCNTGQNCSNFSKEETNCYLYTTKLPDSIFPAHNLQTLNS